MVQRGLLRAAPPPSEAFLLCIIGFGLAGAGDRAFKLGSGTTSEYGRYVKSLGEPVGGEGAFPGG